MTIQTINIGNYNDDGTGDTLREGAQKINDNFTELDNRTKTIISGVVAGDGISVSYSPSTGRVTIINSRVYQPSFGRLEVSGQDTIESNSPTASLKMSAGDHIHITTNATTDTVDISAIWPDTFNGPTNGLHTGNVVGNVTGDVTGDIIGDVWSLNNTFKVVQNANAVGDVRFYGKLIGDVTGNVFGDVVGDVIGDVTGNVSGNAGTVTNGVYTTSSNIVTNAMLAGSITNSKLANSKITINGTDVSLGGEITIPQYVLPTASADTLGGFKVGLTLAMNIGTKVLDTIQDIRTTASPTFAGLTTSGTITVNGNPTTSKHAANKQYVDTAITTAIDAIPPLPPATQDFLGGIIVGEGLEIDNNGILSTVQDISITSSPWFENLTIDNHIILNTGPVLNSHAVTKGYVDEQINLIPHYILPTASDVLTGGIRIGSSLTIDNEDVCTTIQDIRTTASPTFASITVPNAPVNNTDVANKEYVDAQGGLPIGGIIMWSGVTIPNRWALCDGTNGTPDLRNKFIIGESSTYPLNSRGNSDTATTSASGAHSHNTTIAGTSLTVNQLPAHTHDYDDLYGLQDDAGPAVYDRNGNRIEKYVPWGSDGDGDSGNPAWFYSRTASTGTGQAHTHTATVSESSNHTHTVSTIPPYYALAFIMKIS